VVEPEPEDMEAFVSASPSDGSSSGLSSGPAVEEPEERGDPALAEAEYEQAVAALRTGNVEGGVARLRRFADENPRHPRADNALYFSGLGLVGLKDYQTAARVFERLIDTYPAGDAMTDGMLRLAECRQRLNQEDHARALYTRLVTQFPGTAAATQAEQRLAALPSQ
jgi:tol-pal system protein YbgF